LQLPVAGHGAKAATLEELLDAELPDDELLELEVVAPPLEPMEPLLDVPTLPVIPLELALVV
jgi:hypothetical protein